MFIKCSAMCTANSKIIGREKMNGTIHDRILIA